MVYASTKYVNEGLKHSRKDNITQFARENVLFKIGDNDYIANVIVAYTDTNEMLLYDIQDFIPTSFVLKKRYRLHRPKQSFETYRAPVSLNKSIAEKKEK